MQKLTFFKIKKCKKKGMGSLESEQQLSTARGSRPNFRPSVEEREIEDGGRRLLGFYKSEAEEENRSVGFVNHQPTEKL